MKRSWSFFYFAALLLLSLPFVISGCRETAQMTKEKTPPDPTVIAQVGDFPITREDVALRLREEKLSSPEIPVDEGRSLVQLQKAFLAAEILKAHGYFTDHQALEVEAERVEHQTLMPERLEQIRKIFGDHDRYLRLFILPTLMNQVIGSYFRGQREYHTEPLHRLQGLARSFSHSPNAANSSGGFERFAWTQGLEAARLRVSRFEALPLFVGKSEVGKPVAPAPEVPAAILNRAAPQPSPTVKGPLPLYEELRNATVGKITAIAEESDRFVLRRLDSRAGEDLLVTQVWAMKNPFDPWFKAEAGKIPTSCSDIAEKQLCQQNFNRLQH